MDISNSLSQQQEQKQNMTLAPQQLASLNLLTQPAVDLENKIEEEMARNPVLELNEYAAVDETYDAPDDLNADDMETGDTLPPEDTPYDSPSPEENMMDPNREDYEEHLDRVLESPEPEKQDNSDDLESRRQYMFDSLVAETSLQESLLEQLRFAEIPPDVRECAEYVIGSLDEEGYFKGSLPDAAQSVGTSLETAEKALALVQSFDPPGIAARDLKECLLLQLDRSGKTDSALRTLICEHFDELAHNKLPQIAKAMKLDMEQLNALIAELRLLNPHPASSLEHHNEPYILPEVTVVPEGDSYVVVDIDPPYGRLTISRSYQKMLENPALAAEDKAYLRAKIDSGKALIHSLELRKTTIHRIAEMIVSNQYDFMKYGPKALKPMTMRQVADKLGLHETTVSRAVSGKYMMTPVGLFEFRFFFSGGFQSGEGEEVSAHAIRNMIRDFVASEDSAKPLSDSKLADMLREHGLDVARRTVAKYREELSIPSSQLRKAY